MAEVIQNVTEKKTTTTITDSSQSKQTSTNTSAALKQSKIGFLPRKKVVPTLLKKDSSTTEKKTEDSIINETSKNSNDKSPVKKSSKTDIVKSNSKTSKHEENGGIKQNGKKSTPSKKSSKSEKDNVPLIQIKVDKSKGSDNSKSSKTKTTNEKSKDSKSKSSPVKTSKTPVKKPSPTKTAENINDKKDASTSKISLTQSTNNSSAKNSPSITHVTSNVTSAPQTLNISNKGRLNPAMKGNINSPVEIKSSDDEDDEMPLSQVRKKCTPVKSKDSSFAHTNITAKKNTAEVNIKMVPNPRGNPSSRNQNRGKLNETVQALYNRQVNGPIQNAMKSVPGVPGKPAPPPLHPVPTKNIIIAIEMDPQKWKSLSPQEQTRIIEHKKELARKHLASNNQSHLIPQHHHPITPPSMNVHPGNVSYLTASTAYHNKSNLIISPTSTMKAHGYHKPFTVNTGTHHSLPPNSYFSPRTPNFPSHMSSRVVPQLGPMQQSPQFNNFNLQQFSLKQEESTMTDLKPLPLTKKIPMPPRFPIQCFGDIAMIVEFVNTFKTLLMQDIKLDAVTLMIGVSPGSDKADIVARILLMLLKIQLNNEDYKVRGLKMELADLPLTEFTVSFLVCQLIKSQLETKKRLRKRKEEAEKAAKVAEKVADIEILDNTGGSDDLDAAMLIDSDSDDDDGGMEKKKKKNKLKDVDVLEQQLGKIAAQLELKEFWQLDTRHQITVLTFLIDLILDSDDLIDYYDEIMEDKHKLQRTLDEQRKKKARSKQSSLWEKKPVDNEKNAEKEDKDKADYTEKDDKPDPYAGMTQRQKEAIKSEIEKTEEKKRERERSEAEQVKTELEKNSAQLVTVTALLKRVMRVEPLGEDRFHRLYWFFTHGIPGLYVSNFCVDSVIPDPLKQEKPKEMWSYYNKEEDINQLLCALTVRGFREEKLKGRIRNEHMAILASVKEIKETEMYNMIRKSKKVQKKNDVKKTDETVQTPKEEIKVIPTEEKEKELKTEEKKYITVEKNMEKVSVDGDEVEKEKAEGGGEKVDDKLVLKVQGKVVVDEVVIKELERDEKMEEDKGDQSKVVGDQKGKSEVVVEVEEKKEVTGDHQEVGEKNSETEADKVDIKGIEEVEGEKKIEMEEGKVEIIGVKEVEGEKKIETEEGKVDIIGVKEVEGEKKIETEEDKVEIIGDEEVEGEKNIDVEGEKMDVVDDQKEQVEAEKENIVNKQSNEDQKMGKIAETIEIDDDDDDDDKDEGENDKLVDVTVEKEDEEDEPYDAHDTSIGALKTDIIESANRIVHGSLGELTELETWTERVSSVTDVQGLKEFVLQIQSCIVPKFFLSPFKATAEDISKDWCKWVEKCMTLSTMHMLYGLLENSIKWESSAEKMRCKVCRRKKGSEHTEQIIVCDGCHLGYHSHCLRPALNYIPEGEWKCPSCMPKEERGKSNKAAKAKTTRREEEDESSGNGSEESSEEGSGHEEVCHECESGGMLILCDTCPLSFHLDCHQPPLHHAPRGNWSCYECTNPRSRKRGNAKKTTKVSAGKRAEKSKYVEYSTGNSEEDDSGTASSEADFVPKKKKKQTSIKFTNAKQKKPAVSRKNTQQKKRAVCNMEESSEDDDGEESKDDQNNSPESEDDDKPKGRRTKKTLASLKNELESNKSTRSSTRTRKTKKMSSEEGDEEEDKSTRPSRGRKKKKLSSDEEEEEESKSTLSSRGRKKKKISSDEQEEEENKPIRSSRGRKKKKISSDEEEEEEEEQETLKSKLKKNNYKKKAGQKNEDDEEDSSKTKKMNSKKKGNKGTKIDEEGENSNDISDNESKEEWEKTQISPTLGNRRPCYAKDGLRRKEAKASNKQKDSTDESPEKSDDDKKDEDDEKDDDLEKEDDMKESDDEKKLEEEKQDEVLRNLSSADRSFRQAGRNSRRCNYEMQACRNILSSLRKHKDAWPFLVPVNVKQAPDYPTIIEKPMDFSLVLKHLDDFVYDDALLFIEDVKLVFENSARYNSDISLVGEAGVRLHEEFQNLLKIHLPEVHATLQS